jgi:hypothetical protein
LRILIFSEQSAAKPSLAREMEHINAWSINPQTLLENLKGSPKRCKNASDNLKGSPKRCKNASDNLKGLPDNLKDALKSFKDSPDNLKGSPDNLKDALKKFKNSYHPFWEAPTSPGLREAGSSLDWRYQVGTW